MANPAPGFVDHPNYEVAIAPLDKSIAVRAGDTLIAESDKAFAVTESRHRPVWYLPMEDVHQDLIKSTDTSTYCPFKGHASYWSIVLPDGEIEDAIWAYLDPFDECEALQGYVSFYTNKVDLLIDGEVMNKDGPGFVR